LGFLHIQQQRALAVAKSQAVNFLRAVLHIGHLVKRDGHTAPARHDQTAKVFRALETRLNFDRALLRQRAQGAHGQVLVFAAHRVGHLLGAHAQRFHGLGQEVDVDFALGAAHQGDRAHAACVFQAFFQHLVGPVGQRHRVGGQVCSAACGHGRGVGHHGHRPHRPAGRVKAQHPRLFDLGAQQRAHGSDFFAHVFGGFAPVHAQLKFNDHHRAALVAARNERVDAGNGVEAFL
jgi:hypothetical protein